jgi:hypothetical protein
MPARFSGFGTYAATLGAGGAPRAPNVTGFLDAMKRILAFVLLALVACANDPVGPAAQRVQLSVVGGDIIYGPANVALPEPLQVVAVDDVTKLPVEGIAIEWRVTSGTGAILPASSTTDINGVAGTTFQPAAVGTYRVRASAERGTTDPEFEIRVVPAPQITAVEPALITTGGTVIVRGSNFSPIADHNAVLFAGVRGTIQSATATELRVTVPSCLPSRNVGVTVALGFATSAATQVQATGTGGTTLTLTVGASRTFSDPAELTCMRLPGGVADAIYLLTAHNVATVHTPPLRFELRALTAGAVTNVVAAAAATGDFAGSFELGLRQRERALLQTTLDEGVAAFAPAARSMRVPQVGERENFNVLTRTSTFETVNATARIVSNRAAIYVDDEAPAPGFSMADLQRFADLFDNPIYPTNVEIFGQHSDIDGSQRVTILFTPRVNALTPPGQTSFAAAYFYGCDLLPKNRCSGSNLGEIFYAMVPVPAGTRWGDARSLTDVLRIVPPVLAHEFQHMIHFARRGETTDALWLSEALAHTAEELVGDALQAQGATAALVANFKTPNYSRAQSYLRASATISMLAEEPPGTLELRGGAWLFLKHLRGHYGENDLLARLTASTRSGVANVTQETQKPWSTLLRDFGVAIWADGAPEFAGNRPDSPQQIFNNFDPRAVLNTLPGGFTLQPPTLSWGDFFVSGSIAASSQTHFRLVAPSGGGANLNFVLSGPRGAPFDATAATHFTILRVR